jgi:hypothetical protein
MRFYQQSRQFYCGVDLHARSMHERESNPKLFSRAHRAPSLQEEAIERFGHLVVTICDPVAPSGHR